jgi:hypothetical protein
METVAGTNSEDQAAIKQRVREFIELKRNNGREVSRESSADQWFGNGSEITYHNGVIIFLTDDNEAAVCLCEGWEKVADGLNLVSGSNEWLPSDSGLTWVLPRDGKAVRFAFIPEVPMLVSKHHLPTPGSAQNGVICLSPMESPDKAACCQERGQDSEVRFTALVVAYTNADPVTGKYSKGLDGIVPPVQWELGYVDLSVSDLRRIRCNPDEDQTIYDIEFIMLESERRIGGFEFNRASNSARWQRDIETVKQVEAAIKTYRNCE